MVYPKYTNDKQNNTRKLSTRKPSHDIAGDTIFDISNKTTSIEPFTNFSKRKAVDNKLNTSDPQYGLCLKTYNLHIS